MEVLILRNTVADKQVVRAGQVISLDPQEARYLIQIKKAEEYKQTKEEEKATKKVKAKEITKRTTRKKKTI